VFDVDTDCEFGAFQPQACLGHTHSPHFKVEVSEVGGKVYMGVSDPRELVVRPPGPTSSVIDPIPVHKTYVCAVFWDIKPHFVLHRRHITSPLQSPTSLCYVRFEVFTAVTMKNSVFWDVTPCDSCKNRLRKVAPSSSVYIAQIIWVKLKQ
jgi:hypothetical protein